MSDKLITISCDWVDCQEKLTITQSTYDSAIIVLCSTHQILRRC